MFFNTCSFYAIAAKQRHISNKPVWQNKTSFGEATHYLIRIVVEDDKSYYYDKDHLGTIRTTINMMGETENAMDYFPYGQEIPDRSIVYGEQTKYKFTACPAAPFYGGKERDIETNYDYFACPPNVLGRGARYYNNKLGLWNSVDPLASKYPGWSLYNYVLGNPLRHSDPNGKYHFDNVNGRIILSMLTSFELNFCNAIGFFNRGLIRMFSDDNVFQIDVGKELMMHVISEFTQELKLTPTDFIPVLSAVDNISESEFAGINHKIDKLIFNSGKLYNLKDFDGLNVFLESWNQDWESKKLPQGKLPSNKYYIVNPKFVDRYGEKEAKNRISILISPSYRQFARLELLQRIRAEYDFLRYDAGTR